jgi:hypothetical protein
MNQQSAAQLQQSYRDSHPGSEVGVVNAAIPERRIISVGGIPPERVHRGDVMTILGSRQAGASVPAIVYDTASGYIQLWYGPLPTGQLAPQVGDLAIWYPGGAAVPTEAAQPPQTIAPPPRPPATRPPMQEQVPPPPVNTPFPAQPAPPPTTMPAETNVPAATLPPSAPSGEMVMPTSRSASPTTRPAADLNK